MEENSEEENIGASSVDKEEIGGSSSGNETVRLENKRLKLENGVDRISDLPDPLIQHILSFLPSTKQAIRTGILSKRWKNQWTLVPTHYIWTDQRLQLLVTTFYDYVRNPDLDISLFSDPSQRHLLLLGKLRQELLTLANDDETQGSPTLEDITDELNDFALLLKEKYPRYYELKASLGETISKKYMMLVRHKRFDDYVPMGGTSRCVAYSTDVKLSKPSVDLFYWTDIRLQHLVLCYYMVLQDLKSDSRQQENKGGNCLMALKKKLCWNVTIPELKHKLNEIFKDYQENSFAYRAFRIRIGKDMCIHFDHLVKLEWNLYKNKDTTSKTYSRSGGTYSRSGGSSSGLKSSASIFSKIDLNDRNADINRIKNELLTSGLELNDEQIAIAMFKFIDENTRSCFLACSAEQRKYFLEELFK